MVEVDKVGGTEFKWGKMKAVGGRKKDVRFYESFTYDGVEYSLYDSVYLYMESEEEPCIGKLVKIWETSDKTKRVKVLWFFRPCEISNFLRDEEVLENELFLASGEGVGLANINRLEAIAGKCNVVCTSKDTRNPRPSDEELHLADFIFFRTFDVKHLVISDKIEENIAGVDVKFLLNRADTQTSSGVLKLGPGHKQLSGNTVASDDQVFLSEPNSLDECKAIREESISFGEWGKEHADPVVLMSEEKSSGEKHVPCAGEDSAKVAKPDHTRGNTSDPSTSNSIVKENVESGVPFFSGHEPVSGGGAEMGNLCNTSDQQENFSFDVTSSRPDIPDVAEKSPLRENESAKDDRKGYVTDTFASRSKDDSTRTESKFGKGSINQVRPEGDVNVSKDSGELDDRSSKRAKLDDNGVLNLARPQKKAKVTKDPGELDDRSSKRQKLDAEKDYDDRNRRNVQRPSHDSSGCDPKSGRNPNEAKGGPHKRPDKKLMNLDNSKRPEAYPRLTVNGGSKTDNKKLEATQRPEADKSRWFKTLSQPWDEQIRAAHKQGTLVLLQNLDPSYTSAEVEILITKAFGESCNAKMIQRTAFSSPDSGQALVIFKTRELAKQILTKLDESCLLLSNGRPLVGRIATPFFPGKQSTFYGHLFIDRLKVQMQRDMKEAVSTSHCSQPNTVEYDMAMEWCLLQKRCDQARRKLHEQQRQEFRKLKATLKSR